jgi:GNAT superfamily N-acetyltransferase
MIGMAEIIDLNEQFDKRFLSLINRDGQDTMADDANIALGILDDDTPFGALVIDPGYDGIASVESLYIDETHRRQGYATELMYYAVEMLYALDDMYSLNVTFADENGENNGLKEFFEYLEFDIEKEETMGAYTFLLKEVASSEYIKGKIDSRVASYDSIERSVKNRIMSGHPSFLDFCTKGTIDESLSCVVNRKSNDRSKQSYLVVGYGEEELVILWANAAEGTFDLVSMLRFAIKNALLKYGPDFRIRVPYINSTSKKIVNKLLGDKAETTETVWNASLSLDWTDEAYAEID